MSSELVVANVQMTSNDDVDGNLMQIENLLEEVFKKASPRLICFPENCIYLRLIEGQKIEGFDLTHFAFKKLSELSQKYNSYFHLGSVPLLVEGHLYNSSVLITPQGQVQAGYQKMHLFDIQLEGQKALRESDAFRHGQRPHILEIDSWKVGESICYDVRFSELYAQYARKEVDLILVPAAFLVKTGEAHWEILLRARAIESQSYVVASAQAGIHQGIAGGTRMTYGHSLCIDPWGVVLSQQMQAGPGFDIVTLRRERIEKVREQIPMKFHRRLPVA